MRIVFLWHQHQPDYRRNGSFILPWVRMHAVKDYLDIPKILADYPIKHTINLVPSLLVQLQAYANGITDPVQKLCEHPPGALTPVQLAELADWVRTLHFETQVKPHQEFAHLWNKLANVQQRSEINGTALSLTAAEWQDLMVYLHLAWTGPVTRTHPTIARIIEKRSGYTHNDLRDVLHVHAETMSLIVPTMVQLEKEGNFEISVTPFYHPILPLLIDTDVARECMRESPLPFPAFQQPNDAAWHVWAAREEWRKHSGHLPAGMWPAEGSISQAALTMMAASGVQWTATDETVLKNTLGANYTPLSAYRPYTATTSAGNIGVLFRDHALSDAIGFEYASWAPEDAVRNMLARLHQRRERILQTWPEEEHAQAVIPIMLDGENCWEFYHNNGELFLRKLMEALSRDENFQSVTCSEVFTQHKRHQTLPTVVAGSWIGGTFDVWIGSAVKNTAWDLLRQTRCAVERAGNPDAEVALIRSLEASDFFWWYDERHLAPHKHVFDEMFRAGLRDIFARIGEIEPVDLSKTMKELAMSEEPAKQEYPISFAHSTMHDADAMTRSLTVETDGNWQRISIHMSRTPSEFEKVECRFSDRHGVHRQIAIMQNEQLFQSAIHDEGMDRPSPTLVRVYVHTSTVWIVGLEEQRAGGRVARTAVTIRC